MGASTLLTEQEFLNLPEALGKRELLNGELIELPPAKHSHSEMVRRFLNLLRGAIPESRIWSETAYKLGPAKWLIPDVSVSWPDQAVIDDWFQKAPMLAIEIASRGNTPEELDQKVSLLLENGAGEVWIVYPKTRSMVVYRRDSTLRVGATADYQSDLAGVKVTPDYRTPLH